MPFTILTTLALALISNSISSICLVLTMLNKFSVLVLYTLTLYKLHMTVQVSMDTKPNVKSGSPTNNWSERSKVK